MLELCRIPIKAKQHVHTTVWFAFPPPVETSVGTDALPVIEEVVPSVLASWEDDLNISKQHGKSA